MFSLRHRSWPMGAARRRGRARGGVLATLGTIGLLASASPAHASGSYPAYVGNYASGTVTPVDTGTNVSGGAITVGSNPYAIAITPDGRTAYVADFAASNTTSPSTVTPISLVTGAPGVPIVAGVNPAGIAITPDGKTASVTNYGSGTVTPITLATGTAGTPIPVGTHPWGIAITPDATTAYVANFGSGTVTPITLATGTPGSAIPVGTNPVAVGITPDGATAYVLNNGSGTLTPITVATDTARSAIITGASQPWGMTITPDGRTAYVANYGAGTVIPVTLATGLAGTPIVTGGNPTGIAISPDQSRAYVANLGIGWLNPITLATGTLGSAIGPVSGGLAPYPVTFSPDQAPIASFAVTPGAAGSPTTFDASPSTVAYGTISSYAWNFGDGQTATTTTPTIAHTYAAAGHYVATLTETDSAGTSTTQVFTGQSVIRNGGPSARTSRSVVVAPAASTTGPTPPPTITNPPSPTRVTISTASSVTATAHGYIPIRVTCPVSSPTACEGTLTITLARARHSMAALLVAVTTRCARGCRPLGQTHFAVRAGHGRRIAIHLSAYGRTLLKHRRSLKVVISVSSFAAGRSVVTERTLTLRAPVSRKRRLSPERS